MRLVRMIIALAVVAAVFAPAALALRFSDNSLLPPRGAVGQKYFHKLDGAGGCNEGNYEFRVIGGTSLPPGLELRGSTTDWRIEGTPAAAGTWTIWLELWGDGGECPIYEPTPKKAERAITITVERGLTLAAPPELVWTAGTPQSHRFVADGGGTLRWSANGLPAGVAMSADGTLAGTPAAAFDGTITISVSDASRTATRSLRLKIRLPLVITPPVLREAEVGEPFTSFTVRAAGGTGTYAWRLEGELPPGLAFDAQTSTVTGTPSAAGTFALKLIVSDSEARTAASQIGVVVRARVAIHTTRLIGGRVGHRFTSRIRVHGGVGPFAFKAVRGRFPLGVRMNIRTGLLVGTPRKKGLYRFTLRVRDSFGVESVRNFSIHVLPGRGGRR